MIFDCLVHCQPFATDACSHFSTVLNLRLCTLPKPVSRRSSLCLCCKLLFRRQTWKMSDSLYSFGNPRTNLEPILSCYFNTSVPFVWPAAAKTFGALNKICATEAFSSFATCCCSSAKRQKMLYSLEYFGNQRTNLQPILLCYFNTNVPFVWPAAAKPLAALSRAVQEPLPANMANGWHHKQQQNSVGIGTGYTSLTF